MTTTSKVLAAVWLVTIACLIGGSLYLVANQRSIVGDGEEYILSSYAFATHLSPDIRETDIHSVVEAFGGKVSRLSESDKYGKEQLISGFQFGKGFLTARNGKMYSYHFWAYPLLASPFVAFAIHMDLNPYVGFTLCNWFLVLSALSYLWLFWKATSIEKHTLAALFLFTGTMYYIWWPHPEVYTGALMVLALMMARDKRYGLALIPAALASVQNPPVAILLVLLPSFALIEGMREKGVHFRALKWLLLDQKMAWYFLLAVALALMPVLFYQYAVGVSNPIAAVGEADLELIGIDRLHSLYFDLSMGMIVAAPGVFMGLAFLISAIAFKRTRNLRLNSGECQFLLLCLVASIAMAIPALTTTNWNHGHVVYSRYAYWAGVPLVFGLVVSIPNLSHRVRLSAAMAVVCIQLITVFYYGIFGQSWRGDYLNFNPIANRLLMNWPQFYNPIPEIFVERLNHREGMPGTDDPERPVYFFPSRENPRKVLLPGEMAQRAASTCARSSIRKAEGDWAYINIRRQSECDFSGLH